MELVYGLKFNTLKLFLLGLVVGILSATNFFYTWCYVSLPMAIFTTILSIIILSGISLKLLK